MKYVKIKKTNKMYQTKSFQLMALAKQIDILGSQVVKLKKQGKLAEHLKNQKRANFLAEKLYILIPKLKELETAYESLKASTS